MNRVIRAVMPSTCRDKLMAAAKENEAACQEAICLLQQTMPRQVKSAVAEVKGGFRG